MRRRSGELITTDESTVIAKPPLDPIVVKNSQGDGGLANPASADESDRNEVLSKIDYLLDQFVASKEGPWGRGRGFSRYARFKRKMTGPSVILVADLV
jgi:hypothetical protein